MSNLSAQVQDFPQMNFEFKDWKDAFDCWYDNYKNYGDNIQFVVCQNSYTSGYWIEKLGTELGSSSRVYNHKQVIALKSRVKKQIKRAEELGVSPRFTI